MAEAFFCHFSGFCIDSLKDTGQQRSLSKLQFSEVNLDLRMHGDKQKVWGSIGSGCLFDVLVHLQGMIGGYLEKEIQAVSPESMDR